MKALFKLKDLMLCDYQFQITHHVANRFKVGESVFLKSNPEYPLIVDSISERDNQVLVLIGHGYIEAFPPECLLQYKYSGLRVQMIHKREWSICLN